MRFVVISRLRKSCGGRCIRRRAALLLRAHQPHVPAAAKLADVGVPLLRQRVRLAAEFASPIRVTVVAVQEVERQRGVQNGIVLRQKPAPAGATGKSQDQFGCGP
jgi:hypothetical protein